MYRETPQRVEPEVLEEAASPPVVDANRNLQAKGTAEPLPQASRGGNRARQNAAELTAQAMNPMTSSSTWATSTIVWGETIIRSQLVHPTSDGPGSLDPHVAGTWS